MQTNISEDITGLLEKIDHLKAAVDAMRPLNPEQEARVMQKFRLDWNYHSNAIEGNSLTYGETIAFLMEGLTAKGKPFKDHLDIKGHNEAINYLMELVRNRHQVTEKDIRDLHKIILVEPYKNPARTQDGQIVEKQVTLGAYKKMPNHVKTPTGEIHYYATPEETPAKMEELMNWLRGHQEKHDLHPVIVAAIFHHRFVSIHPFDDGNGRMSRLLMNLLLLQDGYPPVILRKEDRYAYYAALRQADGGELVPFIELIGENLVHSLDIYLRGARGESTEEESDLDKEIALLKGSLGDREEAISKDKEILYQLLSGTILPLYESMQNKCRKLDELFFRVEDRVLFREISSKVDRELATINWAAMEQNWLRGKGFGLGQYGNILGQFNYEYHWINFKKTEEPFSVHCLLIVHFQDFKYEIEFDGTFEKFKVAKIYSEKLSKEETDQISALFVREAIARIKSVTGK